MAPLSADTTSSPARRPEAAPLKADRDGGVTRLYRQIDDGDWGAAFDTLIDDPAEARTWIVFRRRLPDPKGGVLQSRFLPLHVACAANAPIEVVGMLLAVYPKGAMLADGKGIYPLHYACANYASKRTIRLLLQVYPAAASVPDADGMLPIHHIARFGPSSLGIVDMIISANGIVKDVRATDGRTPVEMALEADYPEREEVAEALSRLAVLSGRRPVARTASSDPAVDGSVREGSRPSDSVADGMSLPSLDHTTGTRSDASSDSSEQGERGLPSPSAEPRVVPTLLRVVRSRPREEDTALRAGTIEPKEGEGGPISGPKMDGGVEGSAAAGGVMNPAATTAKDVGGATLATPAPRRSIPFASVSKVVAEIEAAHEEIDDLNAERVNHGAFASSVKARLIEKDAELVCLRAEICKVKNDLNEMSAQHEKKLNAHIAAMSVSMKAMVTDRARLVEALANREQKVREEREAKRDTLHKLLIQDDNLSKEGEKMKEMSDSMMEGQINGIEELIAMLNGMKQQEDTNRLKEQEHRDKKEIKDKNH